MGVKSLWSLLTPVGRPVMLETVEGKIMAIDSSIWIYQFQATMRDKDGRALVNAHVLGFLRRISKLLFYGIKPVFVFDGGAPTLKRSTLNERRKKKSGAAITHAKLAEKLLAAQMRREALNHSQSNSKGKSKVPAPPSLNDDTVYLEDVDGSIPKTPRKKPPPPSSTSANKKVKFHDHDPYRLPEVDLEAAVAKATRSSAPDPRLATEDELRTFIEDMRPEDFDVNSPAFRELPTEVQYEIVGDLRLKSRQTSFARLQKMLKTSRTPLDFSKQQIQNLRQRNALTQQLLITTDTIGSAHISIPVRIASERNKEYVLIKNKGDEGGWVLGIRDTTGSRDKPIEIDQNNEKEEEDEEDEDADMEEVEVPAALFPLADPDLRQYQHENALSAIESRKTDKRLASLRSHPITRKARPNPLFNMSGSDISDDDRVIQDDDDQDLAFAIQASLDQGQLSQKEGDFQPVASSSSHKVSAGMSRPSSSRLQAPPRVRTPSPDSDNDIYVSPNRLNTALTFARSSHLRTTPKKTDTSMFGRSSLLGAKRALVEEDGTDSEEDMEEVIFYEAQTGSSGPSPPQPRVSQEPQAGSQKVNRAPTPATPIDLSDRPASPAGKVTALQRVVSDHSEPQAEIPASRKSSLPPTKLNDPLEIFASIDNSPEKVGHQPPAINLADESDEDMEEIQVEAAPKVATPAPFSISPSPSSHATPLSMSRDLPRLATPPPPPPAALQSTADPLFIPASRSQSPSSPRPSSPTHDEDFDAAAEMDLHAEEGEFARFISQVKGRDFNEVRREVDEEINKLNQQRKVAMRDSEDITQQMTSQIMTMLRLFGIPYITAPMEAEAQCAELVTLGLVDGVITDDSDVFLFGAARVFKNMFNQSKTVECFLLSDLERELGLNRDTLIQLAYLLGSDYVEGMPGVGPVVAMELLKEFPGRDGLWRFKEWWGKVQSGKDTTEEIGSKFRKMFKKKFKDLYLASDWPNTAVRDAYYHPAVDSSDEPFKWGLPDLDGLRSFFREELSWSQTKVDDLLLPIIQKMNKRSQFNALNKQGNLNEFLDVTAGSGTYAPRQRQAYASKRLQQVVSDFRKKRQRIANGSAEQSRAGSESGGESSEEGPAKKKRKAPVRTVGAKGKGKARASSTPSDGVVTGSAKRSQGGKAPVGSRRKTTVGPSRFTGKRKKKAKAPASSGNEDESVSDGGDDAFTGGGGDALNIEVPLNVELRPRPKPRPLPRRVVDEGHEISAE